MGERLEDCPIEELHSLEVKLEKSLHCIRGRKVSYFLLVVVFNFTAYNGVFNITNELKLHPYAHAQAAHDFISSDLAWQTELLEEQVRKLKQKVSTSFLSIHLAT